MDIHRIGNLNYYVLKISSILHTICALDMDGFSFKKVKQCKQIVKYLALLCLCIFSLNCSSNSPKFVPTSHSISFSENAININEADVYELEQLPYVGMKTAESIIEHREKFGDFRRPEHLLLVAGISDKRFRNMRTMIKVK